MHGQSDKNRRSEIKRVVRMSTNYERKLSLSRRYQIQTRSKKFRTLLQLHLKFNIPQEVEKCRDHYVKNCYMSTASKTAVNEVKECFSDITRDCNAEGPIVCSQETNTSK